MKSNMTCCAVDCAAMMIPPSVDMAMGAPDGGQELLTRRVSSSAGRPPTWCWAATARFFLMVALLAVGCALLVASYAPRPATAVWVG